MRITQINAYSDAGKVTVALNVESDLPISEALASVLALFAGSSIASAIGSVTLKPFNSSAAVAKELNGAEQGVGGTGDPQVDEAIAAAAAPKSAEEPAKATRTRRPRANPDAAPAVEHYTDTPGATFDDLHAEIKAGTAKTREVSVDAPVEGAQRRRTRATQEPTTPEIKIITDADLAKACSNAAAIVGIEVVQAVIADFHVASMQELAPDVRERFLSELQDEIELAKAELAAAVK